MSANPNQGFLSGPSTSGPQGGGFGRGGRGGQGQGQYQNNQGYRQQQNFPNAQNRQNNQNQGFMQGNQQWQQNQGFQNQNNNQGGFLYQGGNRLGGNTGGGFLGDNQRNRNPQNKGQRQAWGQNMNLAPGQGNNTSGGLFSQKPVSSTGGFLGQQNTAISGPNMTNAAPGATGGGFLNSQSQFPLRTQTNNAAGGFRGSGFTQPGQNSTNATAGGFMATNQNQSAGFAGGGFMNQNPQNTQQQPLFQNPQLQAPSGQNQGGTGFMQSQPGQSLFGKPSNDKPPFAQGQPQQQPQVGFQSFQGGPGSSALSSQNQQLGTQPQDNQNTYQQDSSQQFLQQQPNAQVGGNTYQVMGTTIAKRTKPALIPRPQAQSIRSQIPSSSPQPGRGPPGRGQMPLVAAGFETPPELGRKLYPDMVHYTDFVGECRQRTAHGDCQVTTLKGQKREIQGLLKDDPAGFGNELTKSLALNLVYLDESIQQQNNGGDPPICGNVELLAGLPLRSQCF